ncbi:RDD family protein [Spiroplasma chrysopicola]|uniref:RDD domain-containing protein n=1 Tax=Spiroplasma chrysopicola DF-1 TaxID=1276227 RepID=R4UA89_9MOLU|nr:RDD family protein [Spiroplasma chrysopicola]AGM24809.1 hypothetical protein SCHRY_v1c02240 [Spiroplasma chrysopicola DF-1]
MKIITKKTTDKSPEFNEQVVKRPLPSTEPEHSELDYFLLASPWRIILARFFDIIIASILPLVLSITMVKWNPTYAIWGLILLIVITFVFLFLYFIVIPYLWGGKTFCKWVLRIKLICLNQKITFLALFVREALIIFIPWLIELLFDFACIMIFKINIIDLFKNKTIDAPIAVIIMKIVVTFYFLWYLGLIFAVIFNKDHQILLDRQSKLMIVKIKPKEPVSPTKPIKKLINRDKKHVHLGTDQPGNLTDEALKEIDELT